MADDKDAKPTSTKKTAKGSGKKAKPTGTKKTGKGSAKKAAKSSAKSSAKKAAPKAKKSASKSSAKSAPKKRVTSLDKSVAQLRDSLEHSVTLSRERIQEVVDDAVKRGRMTHGDAEKMIGELLKRGRKQTDALLSELEKLVRQARRKLP
jgi:polyhydroxyalkanoate synthesis regulator phasin